MKVIEKYVQNTFQNADINILANSFGAYITLLKLKQDQERNVQRVEKSITFKAPAIKMNDVFENALLKESKEEYISKGYAKAGKDEIELPYSFYQELCDNSVENLTIQIPTIIYQGTGDTTVNPLDTEMFAKNNSSYIKLIKLRDSEHQISDSEQDEVVNASIRNTLIDNFQNIRIIKLPKKCEELCQDEIELAKVRKLQILTAPLFMRNYDFFYQPYNYKLKRKIYNEKVKLEEGKDNYYIVCNNYVELTIDILNENGIEARSITCDDDEFSHKDIEITTKNGNKYIINLLSDLENTQTGLKPERFASETYLDERYKEKKHKYSFITDKVMKKIDRSLGFLEYDMYLDEVLYRIGTEFMQIDRNNNLNIIMQDEDDYSNYSLGLLIERKIDYLMNFLNQRGNIRSQIELVRYYKMIIEKLFSKEEQKQIKLLNSYINKSDIEENSYLEPIFDETINDEKEKWRFLIISVNGKYYLISCKSGKYIKLDEQEMRKKINANGIHIIQKKKGILKEYIRNKGINVKLIKHPIVEEQIFRFENQLTGVEPDKIEEKCSEIFNHNFSFGKDNSSIKIKNDDETYTEYYFEGDELIAKNERKKIMIKYMFNDKTGELEKVFETEFELS